MIASNATGALLRTYRIAAGHSQPRLAALSGYTHSHISRVERGSRQPSRQYLLSIAAALQLTVQQRAAIGLAMTMRVDGSWEPEVLDFLRTLVEA